MPLRRVLRAQKKNGSNLFGRELALQSEASATGLAKEISQAVAEWRITELAIGDATCEQERL
jgi:hypothetical protein